MNNARRYSGAFGARVYFRVLDVEEWKTENSNVGEVATHRIDRVGLSRVRMLFRVNQLWPIGLGLVPSDLRVELIFQLSSIKLI